MTKAQYICDKCGKIITESNSFVRNGVAHITIDKDYLEWSWDIPNEVHLCEDCLGDWGRWLKSDK